ncbi:hypothetical protein ACH9L7_09905 [Haloferax sp. S1W]|uniref:hypothetical protein n=1 Tax=Haloferax sp. S1W TaxID=3377110 RepID=UPI0037CCA296
MTAGFGFYQQSVNTCESGYIVVVDRLPESADTSAEVVAYENLSAPEQRAFERILASETRQVFDDTDSIDGLSETIVRYEGEQYETGQMVAVGCGQPGVFAMYCGIAATLFGGIVALVARLWPSTGPAPR